MKTSVNLIRKMGNFDVLQRTSDGYFCATSLIKQWNNTTGNDKRDIDNFWKGTNLPQLMSEIAENELGFTSVDFTVLKKALSKTSKARSDRGGGTWMHPILFIKLAMYLNPKFEYHVLRFVADQLIAYRIKIGDNHVSTMKCLKSLNFEAKDYSDVNKAINYIVFNNHEKDIRNTATVEQMNEVENIQDKIKFAVDMDMVTTKNQVIELLRKIYKKKHQAPF